MPRTRVRSASRLTDQDSSAASWAAPVAASLMVVFAATLTFIGALGYSFSQDDFVGLARAMGIEPRLEGLWRLLSRRLFFDVMHGLAGLHAMPYHLVSLIGHAGASVAVFLLVRRFVDAPAALIGAAFFATHPTHFTALYWIAANGEVFSLLFALAALLLGTSRAGAWKWVALPLFAISLLWKESTLFLPIVMAAAIVFKHPGPGGAPAANRSLGGRLLHVVRDPIWLSLALLSALYLASYTAADAFGVRGGLPPDAAYAVGFDQTLWRNALTYLGWTVNFTFFTVHSFMDAVDPAVFPYGIAAAIAWIVGLMLPELRRRGFLVAGVLYLAFLLPVLPLKNHTYHYYLYASLSGAALALGAVADWLLVRLAAQGGSRATGGQAIGVMWVLAVAMALLLTWNGTALVRKIEHHPFRYPELRSDPIVDRARIAERVRQDLKAAELPDRVHLIFWSPSAIAAQREAGRDTARESYIEHNVRIALQDGLAVRVWFPQIEAVSFTRSFRPEGQSTRYAVYELDGRVRVARSEEIEAALASLAGRPNSERISGP